MNFIEELKKETNPSIIKIGNYLLSREDIQDSLKKEHKSLKEMWNYIVSTAKKLAETENCLCVDDDVVFGWAVHYYDEDNITVDSVPKAKVVTDSKSKTDNKSSKEIEKYKKDLMAKEKEIKELKEKIEKQSIPKVKKSKPVNEDQMALF